MSNRRARYVALLRGINVGGKNKIPMAGLRTLCARIDCEDVLTYIQSGNIVSTFDGTRKKLQEQLEKAIAKEFDLTIPVIVRTASGWERYVKSNPFPGAAQKQANWVLLCLSRRSPGSGIVSKLLQHANQGERIEKTGDGIWIHYANGIARSKLTTALLDRCAGSPVTARNWRTVLKLNSMIRATRS
jgi:uncharacterized protein (DUF1697 family)